jgi:phosphoribosylanthranilate isomerase
VIEAVKILRPDVVDVSSGVELRPGIKDPGRVRVFIGKARSAASDPESADEPGLHTDPEQDDE